MHDLFFVSCPTADVIFKQCFVTTVRDSLYEIEDDGI